MWSRIIKVKGTSCRAKPRTMENYALEHVPEYELLLVYNDEINTD